MDSRALWQRYQQHLCQSSELDLSLDISRMTFGDDFFQRMAPAMTDAYQAMDALEGGAIANPDEHRMVGHYWLRSPELAPSKDIAAEITTTLDRIERFAADVHAGRIKPLGGGKFTRVLSIGIGGSALGPMFVHDALGDPATDRMEILFIDNTDPDGIDRTLRRLAGHLQETLAIVISKSGGTPDTRNAMVNTAAAYRAAGLDFGRHAVAITGEGSHLDQQADAEKWVARFPMWDWVGGRTSELSAVGLLPAALQGLDIRGMLAGAAACDQVTRRHDTPNNPAALLAIMWFHATGGQ